MCFAQIFMNLSIKGSYFERNFFIILILYRLRTISILGFGVVELPFDLLCILTAVFSLDIIFHILMCQFRTHLICGTCSVPLFTSTDCTCYSGAVWIAARNQTHRKLIQRYCRIILRKCCGWTRSSLHHSCCRRCRIAYYA